MIYLFPNIYYLKVLNCKLSYIFILFQLISTLTCAVNSDEKEKTWIWKTEGQTYFLDVDEKIRFRVEDELFNDTKPHGPIDTFKDPQLEDDQKDKVPPYALVASCCAEGMGPTTWWD